MFFRGWQAKRSRVVLCISAPQEATPGAARAPLRNTRLLQREARGCWQSHRDEFSVSGTQAGSAARRVGLSADTTTGWTRATGLSVPQCRQAAGSKAARGRQQGRGGQWQGGGSACDAAAGVLSSTKGSPGRGVGRRRQARGDRFEQVHRSVGSQSCKRHAARRQGAAAG